MKFYLQPHNATRAFVLTLADPLTVLVTDPPDGCPARISGPSTKAAITRAVALLLGLGDPTGGFTLSPVGTPGPVQWRTVYEAAAEVVAAKPDDLPAAVAGLRAVLGKTSGDSIAATTAPVAVDVVLSEAQRELVEASVELAGLIEAEKLWKAATLYCRTLVTQFDPEAAAKVLTPWEKAKALAKRIAASAAALVPPKTSRR